MEFNATYPWFLELGPISVPRYEFLPIRFTNPAEVLRDPLRRSTLRMQWSIYADPEGRVCLRAMWDARRHIRSMVDQR